MNTSPPKGAMARVWLASAFYSKSFGVFFLDPSTETTSVLYCTISCIVMMARVTCTNIIPYNTFGIFYSTVAILGVIIKTFSTILVVFASFGIIPKYITDIFLCGGD